MARANSTMRARPIGNDPTGSARTAVSPHCSSTSPTRSRRARSRARRVGKRAMSASIPPPPPRHSKRRQDVVLDREPPEGLHPLERPPQAPPRPRRRRRRSSMFAPRNHTRPSLGVRTPEITSKRVVLPAPFGPMRPHTAPSATVRLTPVSALMPPKRTPTSSSASTACERSGSAVVGRSRTLSPARAARTSPWAPDHQSPIPLNVAPLSTGETHHPDRPESLRHQLLCQVLD